MCYEKLFSHRSYLNYYNIPPEKIVQAVPWYGPNYPCSNNPQKSTDICICPLPYKTQVDDDQIWNLIELGKSQGYEPVLDSYTKTNKILYKDDQGVVNQVWFDDSQSLNIKFEAVSLNFGLRGVAAWHGRALDYSGKFPEKTASIWGTLNQVCDELDALREVNIVDF